MASTVNKYGLTAAIVLADLPEVEADSAQPDSIAIERYLEDGAGLIDSAARPDADLTQVTASSDAGLFYALRGILTEYVLARWHYGNQRDFTELASQLRQDVETYLDKWRETPSQVAGATGHVHKLTVRQKAARLTRKETLFG